jgi:hypothetical protein
MASALYCVTIEVDPAAVDEWNRWYTEHHVPDVLAQPGFLGAQRYADEALAKDGWKRFVSMYEVESPRALEEYLAGDAVTRLRADHVERFGKVTRLSRQVLRRMA